MTGTANVMKPLRCKSLKTQKVVCVFLSLKVCYITGNGGQGEDWFGCKFKEKDGFERAVVSAHRGGLSSPLRDIETTISHEHCANQMYQNEK